MIRSPSADGRRGQASLPTHCLPGTGDGGDGRAQKEFRFEQDNQSALDGGIIWAMLKELGKVFGVGEFDAKALLHNLGDLDYERPLDEVRDSFWNTPRMPLLAGAEADLQRGIFEALVEEKLRLVGADGSVRVVTKPSEIGVGSASLRLARQQEEPVAPEPPEPPGPLHLPQPHTQLHKTFSLKVSLNTNLDDEGRRASVFKLFDDLAAVVDSHEALHVQLSVSVVVPEKEAEGLTTRAQAAGGTASSTPLD